MFGSNANKEAQHEMQSLVKEAQELMRETSKLSGEKADDLRKKGMSILNDNIAKAKDMGSAVANGSAELMKTTDGFVQESPWRAVAITSAVSVGIGVLLGMSVSHK